MKIVKKFGLLLLLFVSTLIITTSCSETSNTTTVPTTTNEIKGIRLDGADNEEVYQGYSYTPSTKIKVYANYTQGYDIDVTDKCTFSKISTSEIGEKTVTVTYYEAGKDFTECYIVNVIKLTVVKLLVDVSNLKMVYKVGDTFDFSKLSVRGVYSNDYTISISSYDISITDQYNNKYSPNDTLRYAGIYDVKLSYQDAKSTFQVAVYDSSKIGYDFKASNTIGYELNKQFDFENEKLMFRSPYATIYAKGEEVSFDYDKYTYYDVSYESSIELDESDDYENESYIKLNLAQKSCVVLLADIKDDALSIRDSNNQVINYIGDNTKLGYVYFEVDAGEYYILASGRKINIYDIYFNFPDETELLSFDSIELKLDSVKTVYKYLDYLDLSNLEVYGKSEDNNTLINSNDYSVEMYFNGEVVERFTKDGTYEVKVTYIGDALCYNREVSYEVKYDLSTIEKLYLTELKINNVDVKLQNGVFEYNINLSQSINSIFIFAKTIGEYNIYVNDTLYTDNMSIALTDSTTNIRVEIKSETMTVSYLIVVRK